MQEVEVSITDRFFDPDSVDHNTLQGIDVFEFADGGRVALHGRYVSSWWQDWLSSST